MTIEKILKQHYRPNSYYVKEAIECKGIELYHYEDALIAMQEYAKSKVKEALELACNNIDTELCYYDESSTNTFSEIEQSILSVFNKLNFD